MAGGRSGGRILVDNLVAQGCDRIFTVPGESFLAVLDALHDVPEIDLVVCRQEGGAAFMACADGTLTGRPGVAFVTRGPGATNASIGVHVAHQDSQPMILFVGDVARGDRQREAFQEIDMPAFFGPIAKWAGRIDEAARIPEIVARAYATAMAGRPGPVVIALAEDMLEDIAEAVDRPRVERPVQAPDAALVERLVDTVERAKSPLAIVGGADWDATASKHFTAFAERMGLPVAAAFRRQDAVPNGSPVYAGNLGYGPNPKLLDRVRDADVLLVVGARLGEATTDGYTLLTPDLPGRTLIHVHPDPEELGRVYRTDMAVCADMASFAKACDATGRATAATGGRDAHAAWAAWNAPAPGAAKLDLALCVAAMRERMDNDTTIICNGAGNFSGWWHRHWQYGAPGTQLAPTAGAMGYGLPAAIAAARRCPDRAVVALAGDGDFLMNGQELATAVQAGCDLIVLVIDNGAYGTIRMHQERKHPGRVSGTTLGNPDFAALARAFGAAAETVTETAGFAPALDRMLATDGVRLIHLVTDVEQIAPGLTVSRLRGD